MQPIVLSYLEKRPDLIQVIRSQPIWYRYLSRNPAYLNELEEVAKQIQGKSFPDRVEKFNQGVQQITMLIQLMELLQE